jgi:hypothetical protein
VGVAARAVEPHAWVMAGDPRFVWAPISTKKNRFTDRDGLGAPEFECLGGQWKHRWRNYRVRRGCVAGARVTRSRRIEHFPAAGTTAQGPHIVGDHRQSEAGSTRGRPSRYRFGADASLVQVRLIALLWLWASDRAGTAVGTVVVPAVYATTGLPHRYVEERLVSWRGFSMGNDAQTTTPKGCRFLRVMADDLSTVERG